MFSTHKLLNIQVLKNFAFIFGLLSIFCNAAVKADEISIAKNLVLRGDFEKAMHILEKPIHSNNPDANYMLGVMFSEGHGVNQNIDKGIEFFEMAAKGGNIDAMINLGSIYHDDLSSYSDSYRAYFWYLSAARSGEAQALAALASMHFTGSIFPPHKSDGVRYALLATRYGWEYNSEFIEYVSSGISEQKMEQLRESLESCTTPFSEACLVSKPLEHQKAFVRTSDMKFMQFKKGFVFDSWEPSSITSLFNNLSGVSFSLPTFFSKKHVKYFPETAKPSVCQVEGKDMGLVWYTNKNMPEGKALEFQKKDYIEFECKEVTL